MGGIIENIYESIEACLSIDTEKILCYEETEQICKLFNIQPLGFIASGALLIALDPKDTKEVIAILAKIDIVCTQIVALGSRNESLLLTNSYVD